MSVDTPSSIPPAYALEHEHECATCGAEWPCNDLCETRVVICPDCLKEAFKATPADTCPVAIKKGLYRIPLCPEHFKKAFGKEDDNG